MRLVRSTVFAHDSTAPLCPTSLRYLSSTALLPRIGGSADGLLVKPPLDFRGAVADVTADLDVGRTMSEIPPLGERRGRDVEEFGEL